MDFVVRFWGIIWSNLCWRVHHLNLSDKTHMLIIFYLLLFEFGFKIPLNLVYQCVVSMLSSFWLCGLGQPCVIALAKKI